MAALGNSLFQGKLIQISCFSACGCSSAECPSALADDPVDFLVAADHRMILVNQNDLEKLVFSVLAHVIRIKNLKIRELSCYSPLGDSLLALYGVEKYTHAS